MKGIIFNLVEDVVTDGYGVDAWEDLLDQSGVQGAYSAVGSYPDAELGSLLQSASSMTGASTDDLQVMIGRQSVPMLQERYPEFFTLHADSRSFLGSLNEVIHPEVRKLYSGAEPPHFDFADSPDGDLIMDYHSHRSLCRLAEGLILGTGDAYGEEVSVHQTQCKSQGAPFCRLVVAFR